MRLPLKRRALFLIAPMMIGIVCTASYSQRRSAPVRGNPDIPKIVAEMSARRIEASIRKLVSFGSRNTLSEQNDPNRGIGLATRLALPRSFKKWRLNQAGA